MDSTSGIYAITTVDNPYNPFENFTNWFLYDVEQGYNTCGQLARVALTSESLTDEENNKIIEDAIDEIIKEDPLNIYMKIKKAS